MAILKISAENAEFQIIQSLKMNRVKRGQLNEIFIEGIECIKQAVKSKIEITRIIIKNTGELSNWGKDIIKHYNHVKIIKMSVNLYNRLTEKTNPSEMLMTAKVKQNTIDDIHAESPFIIVFDRPSDYGNLGAIIRSANAFNADGIFIIGHGVDTYESKVIRASLGGIFFQKIVKIKSMEELIKYAREQKIKNGMEIVGTDSAGTISLKECKLKLPLMLIIGNEAKGMSKKLTEICDKIIGIPMNGDVNSLNVSCASSIIMWEIFKNTN